MPVPGLKPRSIGDWACACRCACARASAWAWALAWAPPCPNPEAEPEAEAKAEAEPEPAPGATPGTATEALPLCRHTSHRQSKTSALLASRATLVAAGRARGGSRERQRSR